MLFLLDCAARFPGVTHLHTLSSGLGSAGDSASHNQTIYLAHTDTTKDSSGRVSRVHVSVCLCVGDA